MATMLGSLLISLGLNSGQFTKGMSDADRELVAFQKQAQRTAGALKDLGAKMTVGITAPLVAFGGFAVKAASDADELQSAFDQTFGSLSRSMTQWAETTGDAMGRSTQEMQQMANTFGIFFNQAAPTGEAAAKLSREFAVLAQDLSSFFNTDPTEALQKLRSGLAGESEPLRDFGVFLTEATVKAKALEMGLASSADAITEQNKIMARAALIMDATTKAQGDVARTADGTANRIREARAAFEELQVAIGTKLLPAVTPLITGLTNMLVAFTQLPDWVQTTTLVVGGLAAVAGPLVYAVGALSTNMILLGGAFATAGVSATGASAGVTLLSGALRGLLLVGGPVTIALGLLAGAVYLMSRRSTEGAQASGTLTGEQKKLYQIQAKVKGATELLAIATGAARREALLNAKATRQETLQYLEKAKAMVKTARAQLALVRAENAAALQRAVRNTTGAGSGYDPAIGQMKRNNAREKKAEDALNAALAQGAAAEQALWSIQQAINAPAPDVNVPTDAGDKPDGRKTTGSGSTGPTPQEIAQRFADEQVRLEMEALQARERLATTSEERADLQLQMLGIEKGQRLAEIDATLAEVEASKMTEDQKQTLRDKGAALREQVVELYGVTGGIDEQGVIVANANKGLLAQQITRDQQYEMEQRLADALQVQFDTRRDHLRLDYEMADTQEERQRIAAEILSVEQEYRRARLKAVITAHTINGIMDAEAKHAQSILDTLDDLDAKERRASAKANRTEAERYVDSLSMSSAQVNEAMDGIKIDGLDALNDGLVEAVRGVKSLGEVFSNIADQIIADLLRIGIRRAIIAPLANALFPGASSVLSGLSGAGGAAAHAASGSLSGALAGRRAMGGPVLAGGNYLVGENGPEIFRSSVPGDIVPNHKLAGLGGDTVIHQTLTFTGAVDLATREEVYRVADAARVAAMNGVAQANRRSQ